MDRILRCTLLLSLFACTTQENPTPEPAGIPAAATAVAADAPVYALACGCALDHVGSCGEYIEVNGAFVELRAPRDLGFMPFCHKEGLRARAEGSLEDGVFIARTFELVE